MINKWLHNESFLRWKLFQIDEDKSFWENFIKENPEMKKEIDEAVKQLEHVKFNNYTLPEFEKQHIFELLRKKIEKRKQKRRLRVYLSISAAACLALFLLLSDFFPEKQVIIQKDILSSVSDSIITNDKDIQLILADNQTIAIEEDANIQYTAQGEIIVNAGNKQIAKKEIEQEKIRLNKLIVPNGKRSSLTLEDGTKVWINSGSSLEFPTAFDANKREIWVDGEIYIEVAKRNDCPFFVNSSRLSVEVLGTRFNVSAYKDDISHAVALVEGSVNVKIGKEKIHLKPDHMLSVTGEQLTTQSVDIYYYISWKDGLLQFSSEPLSGILTRLSRCYNVSIECDKDIENIKCTGKLVLFDNIQDVLQTIHNTISVSYTIHENKVFIKKK